MKRHYIRVEIEYATQAERIFAENNIDFSNLHFTMFPVASVLYAADISDEDLVRLKLTIHGAISAVAPWQPTQRIMQ